MLSCASALQALWWNTTFSTLTPRWLSYQRAGIFSHTDTNSSLVLTTSQPVWGENKVAVCMWRSHSHWKHSHMLLQASSYHPVILHHKTAEQSHSSSRSFYSFEINLCTCLVSGDNDTVQRQIHNRSEASAQSPSGFTSQTIKSEPHMTTHTHQVHGPAARSSGSSHIYRCTQRNNKEELSGYLQVGLYSFHKGKIPLLKWPKLW